MDGTFVAMQIVNKYIGEIYQAKSPYSPYDVVGWRGNYAPCKYNLELFNSIGSISFDHPDPCIFTVLTCKSAMEGYTTSNSGPQLWIQLYLHPDGWLVRIHSNRHFTIGTACLSTLETFVMIMMPRSKDSTQAPLLFIPV